MFNLLFAMAAEEAAGGGGIAWWVWLILIIILLVILWYWFGREEEETASVEPEVKETPVVAEKTVAAPVAAEVASAEPEEKEAVVPDDLKKIEGIGPKVSSLLNEAGIFTFAQLAETATDKLSEILDANKLQYMDPSTWAEQAKLAAAGDWEGLEKLQDALSGGKR